MSDDNTPPVQPSPAAAPSVPQYNDFLTGTRDLILGGKTVYGDPASSLAQAKLQELDAKIALGRRLGEIAPAPEPWTETRAARERMALEFPMGEPTPEHPDIAAFHGKQLEALGQADGRKQAQLAQSVADDIGRRTSAATMPHSTRKNPDGSYLSGAQQVDALLADATPAIQHLDAEQRELLRLDRQLLENYAVRGRNISAFRAAKSRYGLS